MNDYTKLLKQAVSGLNDPQIDRLIAVHEGRAFSMNDGVPMPEDEALALVMQVPAFRKFYVKYRPYIPGAIGFIQADLDPNIAAAASLTYLGDGKASRAIRCRVLPLPLDG